MSRPVMLLAGAGEARGGVGEAGRASLQRLRPLAQADRIRRPPERGAVEPVGLARRALRVQVEVAVREAEDLDLVVGVRAVGQRHRPLVGSDLDHRLPPERPGEEGVHAAAAEHHVVADSGRHVVVAAA
jgi:hypothetical protein